MPEQDLYEVINEAATDLANRRGGDAYKKLCADWEISYVPEVERIFKAGFAMGIRVGMETVLKAGEACTKPS